MSHEDLHRDASLQGEGQSPDRRSPQELFHELWSQALVAVGGAEDEVRKVLDRVSDALAFHPDELQQVGRDLVERLQSQRKDLETSLEEGVRGAVARLRLPSPVQQSASTPPPAAALLALHRWLSSLETRMTKVEEYRKGSGSSAQGAQP